MKFWAERFNLYLILLLVAVLLPACQSPEKRKKKQISTFRVHVEATPDISNRTQPVSVFRQSPVTINIDRTAFVGEENVVDAAVVEDVGGWAVRVQLDRQGTWMLEQFTGANRGKRLAIFATFGVSEKKDVPKHMRWIAAPRITQRITDGMLTFTPDASREEADEFVLGLKNAAKKFSDLERKQD